jgi:hypothetical protein
MRATQITSTTNHEDLLPMLTIMLLCFLIQAVINAIGEIAEVQAHKSH